MTVRAFCVFLLFGAISQAHAVCYVDARAAGANSGSSWVNSYTNLQFALLDAACKEVWVAKGVYKPTLGSDPSISFNIAPGVAVYGGFAGGESNRNARDSKRNPTVLSGDIENDDVNVKTDQIDQTWGDIRGNNSNHVIVMDGTEGTVIDESTVLDGFIVTGGLAHGPASDEGGGSGLYCDGRNSGSECSPSLSNLIFSGNWAAWGALFNDASNAGKSSPTLVKVAFLGNHANAGAAVYNFARGGPSNPHMTDVIFRNNSAISFGGAMFNDVRNGASGSPLIENSIFENNHADCGGALYSRGLNHGHSDTTIVNSTFVGNSAENGGGVICENTLAAGTAITTLLHVTVFTNDAYEPVISTDRSASSDGSEKVSIINTIIWGKEFFNPPIVDVESGVRNSILPTSCPENGTCFKTKFGDPVLGPLGQYGGFTQTLLPSANSPAIDAADDANCPPRDERGVARPQGSHCDIGAVEWRPQDDIIFKNGFESPMSI